MEKFQDNLRQLIKQYPFIEKCMKYDVIFLGIYPIYRLLWLLPIDFKYKISNLATIFIFLFIFGLLLAIANDKLKYVMPVMGFLTIISVVNVFSGDFDDIVYAAIYGFITYRTYKMLNTEGENIAETIKKCSNCGKEVAENETFSTNCGEKIDLQSEEE